jgi:hypothetical protein
MGALGQTAGNLAQQQQDTLAQIGTQAGGLASADIARQLTGAGQLADMGAQAQNLGLAGAGALGSVGALQQQQGQKNLDVAYADFLRQQGYPQEQIDNMLKTFQGVSGGVPQADKTYGISPSSVEQKYPASTASQVGGALTGAAGILADLKKAGVI